MEQRAREARPLLARLRREARRSSHRKAALRIGISHAAVAFYIHGKRLPSRSVMEKLKAAYPQVTA